MKNLLKYFQSYWLVGAVIAFFPTLGFGQTLQELSQEFDNIIGRENLAIQNGPLNYQDYPFVIEGKTKYLLNQGFAKGNVRYDGQLFYKVNLKYDLYLDVLVFNPENAPPTIGANLIQQKVDSFFVLNRKFVNIDKLPAYENSGLKGYFQKIEIGSGVNLYVKFTKTKRKVLKESKVFYAFDLQNSFVLNFKGSFYELSSARDLQNIFPGQKKAIAKFADQYKHLRSSDPVLYYQNLITHVNGLSEN